MKAPRLHTAIVVMVSLILLSSTATADPLTKYGLKPVGSYDLGGNTVTIISWAAARMETYFQTYPPVAGRIAEAEKVFNCKIVFLQTRDIPQTNFNRLMSGESAYDLWNVQNKIGYFDLVSEGAAYPVQDLLPAAYWDALMPGLRTTEEALKFKGKYYGIGNMEWRPVLGYDIGSVFVGYNKTLLEREGLPDPYELYVDGEWTWDKATEIAQKATRDTDGDGQIDQYGMTDLRAWDLAVSNGASIIRVDPSGRVVYSADEDAYIEALEQYQQWYSTGVLNHSNNTSGNRDLFINGKAAMHFNITAGTLSGYVVNGMADEWGLVPFPKGPRATGYVYPTSAMTTTLIPVNAKDPEALVALRAFLWQEEDVTVNDVLASNVRSQDAAGVFLEACNVWDGTASRLLETYISPYNDAITAVRNGAKSPAVAMAEIRPVIQATIDDLFNQ